MNTINEKLFNSIFDNDINEFKSILNNETNLHINTALMYATDCNNIEMVTILILKGAQNIDGSLILASQKGFKDLVKLFINAGAEDKRNALIVANDEEIRQILRSNI